MNFGRDSAQYDFYMNLNVEDAHNAKQFSSLATNVIYSPSLSLRVNQQGE